MLKLLICEFKKFKNTYINSLSFLGMLFPTILVALMFLVRKADFVRNHSYDWSCFNSQVMVLFVFLIGPIITSFIAVFSVFYEYQEKTMKNILSSPNSRTKIILTKIIYVSLFVLLQYAIVAILNVLFGMLFRFADLTPVVALQSSMGMIAAGFTTIILVPLMIFITLICKNFIPPLVLTVIGTISNALLLNWEKSYLSPWANPANFVFILNKTSDMNIIYPLVYSGIYFILFMALMLVYFNKADQSI